MQPGGFSEAVRLAITVAHGEAVRLGRDCVSVDLVILGIIDADLDGLAAHALRAEGIELAAMRRHIVGPADPRAIDATVPSVHVPFCAETREAVSLAGLERENLGHDQVDTVRMLLALMRVAESRMAELLGPFGVNPAQVRKRMGTLLG